MTLLSVSLAALRRRAGETALHALLLALGIATIVVLLLFSAQAEERLTRDARGIDLVVGATGSPLQLILSSIYHLDAPTGNVALADVQPIMQNRAVEQAIPLALGDSYAGYRVVGTTTDYPAHYEAELADGALWSALHEVTLGAHVAAAQNLGVGDTLATSHGLVAGGQSHGDAPLHVVGVLAPSGTVVDRLVLTSVETVWAVHGTHTEEGGDGDADDDHAADDHAGDAPSPRPMAGMAPGMRPGVPPGPGSAGAQAGQDVTAVLIRYSSPLAAALFPRAVNAQPTLQAASPAFETARLFNLMGLGTAVLRAFGFVLVLAAGLGVFLALWGALRSRRGDLALLRTMGASRGDLFRLLLTEGLLLAVLGLALGLLLGHGGAAILVASIGQAEALGLRAWTWAPGEGWLILGALAIGLLAALLPAIQAYRTDIAATLARN